MSLPVLPSAPGKGYRRPPGATLPLDLGELNAPKYVGPTKVMGEKVQPIDIAKIRLVNGLPWPQGIDKKCCNHRPLTYSFLIKDIPLRGQMEPIWLERDVKTDTYILNGGKHRTEACLVAGYRHVWAIVIPTIKR